MDSNREMDPEHQVPEGVDEKTLRALGALSKALETTERARGHLYGFHQLTGTADFELGDIPDGRVVGRRPALPLDGHPADPAATPHRTPPEPGILAWAGLRYREQATWRE
ncbi:hypothetical protein AB0B44_37750, partial [Streptomyces sp. NPDC041003]